MNTKSEKTGFIGAGNMATALIKGLIQSGLYSSDQLLASDNRKEALKSISEQFGLQCYASNAEMVAESSVVILCVKPQNIKEILEEVSDKIREDHLIISIAAGIPLKMIHSVIDRDIPLIRVMPNTPALVQKGISALAGGDLVTLGHMNIAKKIFGAVGDTVEVQEDMMDAVTALSGSGPGYIFRMMECMVDAGTAEGLKPETSLELVIQTFLGAAYLAKESDHSLTRLREMVTSPGGTTAAGLSVFNNMGLEEMTKDAVGAACKRSVELGKNY